MAKPRIVFSDYDNTFSMNGLDGASDFGLSAIHQLKAAGVYFAPVSGRVHLEAVLMFRGDESCGETGAFCNGQEVWVDGECICNKRIMREDLQRVVDVANELGDVMVGMGNRGVMELDLVTSNPQLFEKRWSIFEHSPLRDTIELDSYLKTNVQVVGTRERLIEVEHILKAEVPQLDFVQPDNEFPMLDIMPAGWNKGSAVRLILETIGATPDEAIAFGDSENDLAMLAEVGTPIAVENAAPEVKAVAARVIGKCADEAVAYELLRIAAS